MNNTNFWHSKSRAGGYAKRSILYPPESTFIAEFGPSMKSWKMLDLGIGGGRSAVHFAPLVVEYIGTDFSSVMVDACVSRFKKSELNIQDLQIADVRNLSQYKLESFDFVLFSFNGIDEINHNERLEALRQIRKVIKINGLFFFSSHNLKSVRNYFKFKSSLRPDRFLKSIYKYFKIRAVNPKYKTLFSLDTYSLIHDYHYDYSKLTYYVHPSEQFRQLETAKFLNLRVYSSKTGDIIKIEETDISDEAWLYYLCKAV